MKTISNVSGWEIATMRLNTISRKNLPTNAKSSQLAGAQNTTGKTWTCQATTTMPTKYFSSPVFGEEGKSEFRKFNLVDMENFRHVQGYIFLYVCAPKPSNM